jgi:hypothetical protein
MYKHAFGKSNSAVYLAEYMMNNNVSDYVMRKVSSKFVVFFRHVKELHGCHLSPELKVWALNKLVGDFATNDPVFTDDKLIIDLMRNVARGKVRDVLHTLKQAEPEAYKRIVPYDTTYEPKEYTRVID